MGDMYWRFVLALVLVVALIFATAWIAKRLGLGGRIGMTRGKRRLAIQEVLSLDGKRRLVLLKRDGVEHLVLFGATNDVVLESGIAAAPEKPDSGFAELLPEKSA